MELILRRERSFTTPRSGTDVTTFSEEEEFRIASKSSLELRILGRPWLKPWSRTTPFLALHTNLAADVAKLGVCYVHRSSHKL